MTTHQPPPTRVPVRGEPNYFFEDENIDRLFGMTMALGAEITAVAEKLDTVLRLLERQAVLTPRDVAAFVPDDAQQAERDTARRAFISVLLAPFQQAADDLVARAKARAGRT